MKNKIIAFSILAGLSFQACEDIVQVEPATSLATSTALSTLGSYRAVLTSAYDRIQTFTYWGRDMALLGDALSDNIYTEVSQASGRYTGVNRNTRNNHFGIWGTAYGTINDLNTIIANIDNLTVGSSEQAGKAQVKAQAQALRAMVYFDLTRIYGYEPNKIPTSGTGANFNKSVVLRLQPTNTPADAALTPRATVTEVYTQIETDLKAAITALDPATTSGGRYVMNKGAAHALLGKVYLYWEKWAQAEEQFKLAMANTNATLAPNIVSAFNTVPNPESLFELNFVQSTEVAGVTGVNESLFTYTQPNGKNAPLSGTANVSTYGGQTPSEELLALFGLTPTLTNQATVLDVRKNFFYRSASSTSGNVTYTWSNKYNAANGAYTDNVKIIRYADVLLMLAEAHVMQGEVGDAVALLTTLKTSRNSAALIPAAQATLLQYIKDERRRELFFEGHRWFDLKRWGEGITKPAATAVGIIPHTDYRILAPIPVAEVTLNPSFPQNPGY
ncbi:RagB/SusD family nutrient uptake outer membrane protein [Rufibacter glacialis]|uniref:RagB/SusD family nutrient uptake outer membrane protein n=1 Tax=Rufibacter glacialis TaxID=1259555 RepID=A0A5M8QM40_9BACT|nr:RagB/SusD family nutrient uptake outer membrane protein [Rufibacter glacialis]KAA6437215.1 RagB/SusD family nutrient uptake outer membrane protein [Rufibacter glacialis]GGK61095.1 membrane protein [Rufibacter glacialis]